MIDYKDQLNKYLVGDELLEGLKVLPEYKKDLVDKSDRLIALLDIYNIYLPSKSCVDVYNRLYMSLINSLQKKNSIEEIKLVNANYKIINGTKRYGVIGGLESFRITGKSGLGKSSCVQRCIELITNNKNLICKKPYKEIIPILFVECVADGSFKGLLYSILQAVDSRLGTTYLNANRQQRITVDILLAAVSNILINHCCVLVIDEIERVANDSKKGETLINYLTQLVNQSNITICFVGNESINSYFELKEYLSRRTIGISITNMEYDEYFCGFLKVLFDYQYTEEKIELDGEMCRLFYRLTNGIVSMVVSLFIESQRNAIMFGKEKLDREIIEETFKNNFSTMFGYLSKEEKIKSTAVSFNKGLQNIPLNDNKEIISRKPNLFYNLSHGTNMEPKEMLKVLLNDISVEYIKV